MTKVNTWGGHRPGAGRKSLRDEKALADLIEEAIPRGEQLELLQSLLKQAKEGNTRAAALVLNYLYGRPLPVLEDTVQREAAEMNALLNIQSNKWQLHHNGFDVDLQTLGDFHKRDETP